MKVVSESHIVASTKIRNIIKERKDIANPNSSSIFEGLELTHLLRTVSPTYNYILSINNKIVTKLLLYS